MTEPKIKLFEDPNGIVHWAYPILGKLTICGILETKGRDLADGPPTCVRCVAMVQVGLQGGLQGDLAQWRVNRGPTRKLG